MVYRFLSHSLVYGDLASGYLLLSSHQSELEFLSLYQPDYALLAKAIRRHEYPRILQYPVRLHASDPTYPHVVDFANDFRQEAWYRGSLCYRIVVSDGLCVEISGILISCLTVFALLPSFDNI